MKFTYGKSTFLTSGDLYRDKELELIARYGEALKADVMKANHHGAILPTVWSGWMPYVLP